ncbi:MAG TPA: A24 family peptidase [Anaeromyxobacter sp.]|jgi:prepilin peptidase CpaA|nr:A24 family peptidase [Anaeromyxobacter sp.]
MHFSPLHLALLMFGLGVAAASDVACRRIPNQLTLPLAVGGVAASAVTFGAWGAAQSLAAAALAGAILTLLWRRGKLGGGDVKIGIAAAAWVGWARLGPYAAWSGIFLGVLALAAYLASARDARQQMRANFAAVARGQAIAPPLQATGARVPVPAGVALGAGALAAILMGG